MNKQLNTAENSRVEAKKRFRWKRAIIVFGVAGLLSIGVIKATQWITNDPGSVNAVTIESTNPVGIWNDEEVQNVLHRMSHEKVIADEKWGERIEMSEENIKKMSWIIEENKDRLIRYETYREIIDKWMEGNFKSADDDHNTIWNIQGGTVGKATGVKD